MLCKKIFARDVEKIEYTTKYYW